VSAQRTGRIPTHSERARSALSGGILDSGITPAAHGHIMNLDEDLITRLIKLDFGHS
jgi:hypothetical protein